METSKTRRTSTKPAASPKPLPKKPGPKSTKNAVEDEISGTVPASAGLNHKHPDTDDSAQNSSKQFDDFLLNSTGFRNHETGLQFIDQLYDSAFGSSVHNDKQRKNAMTKLVSMLKELAPRDATEGLLIRSMIGASEAAMQCLNIANNPDNHNDIRSDYHKHTQRYMKLYTDQLAALDKHRNRGQQKISVKHVHVNEGGQAVVGNIATGKQSDSVDSQAMIDLHPGEPVPMPVEQSPAKKSVKK